MRTDLGVQLDEGTGKAGIALNAGSPSTRPKPCKDRGIEIKRNAALRGMGNIGIAGEIGDGRMISREIGAIREVLIDEA